MITMKIKRKKFLPYLTRRKKMETSLQRVLETKFHEDQVADFQRLTQYVAAFKTLGALDQTSPSILAVLARSATQLIYVERWTSCYASDLTVATADEVAELGALHERPCVYHQTRGARFLVPNENEGLYDSRRCAVCGRFLAYV
jgi:hypothetical protein